MSHKETLAKEYGIDIPFEPWAHQAEGIRKSLNASQFMFFYDVGTGKTVTAITSARIRMAREKKALKVLVVTPLITLKNWMFEWRKFSKIDHKKIVPLTGTGEQRLKMVREGAQVFIASYETMLMPKVHAALKAWGPDILIVDELQRCKNHRAKRSKAIFDLAKNTRYRYGLTGTPILQSPMDLFGEFLVVDLGETFGQNFPIFRSTYFFDKNAGMPIQKYFPDWRLRKGADEAIQAKIQKLTMTAKKSEVLDLPPYVQKDILLEMHGEQKRMYKELEKDFLSYIDDKACVATMALTKGLRLLQIASGYVSLEDVEGKRSEKCFDSHGKKSALRELLEEITPSQKVIVWASFSQNYADIRGVCDELGIKYVEITGEVSTSEKFKGMDAFNTDPSVRVCLGHPAAGGVGVNLIAASVNIYYSRTFSLEDYLQSQARCYRGGSERHESITEINLICEGTIDELVAQRLSSKIDVSNKILRDIAQELKRGK